MSDVINLALNRKNREKGLYALRQLGTDDLVLLSFKSMYQAWNSLGWLGHELIEVVLLRTLYLNDVLSCAESLRAISHLTKAKDLLNVTNKRGILKIICPGHIYQMVDPQGKPLTEKIVFVQRSGGAIKYETEWSGLQTQEVFRALIEWFMLTRKTWEIADLCRQALFEYEARAYRRKRQEFNRKEHDHQEIIFPYEWEDIENMPIGKDGHIQYIESEILYYGYFGACDAEPIPGVDPFMMENDPVYKRVEKELIKK